jgi:hypothetical protein
MSVLAKVSGEWRTVDCSENSGIYVRDAGEWISLCPETEVLPPFELITGYTIDHVGTSASLVGGQVEFEGVTSLSLNGVFSSEFRNYEVVIDFTSAATTNSYLRLRSSVTGESQSGYVYQYLIASGPTPTADRSNSTVQLLVGQSTPRMAHTINVYGPALDKPTAFRSVSVNNPSGAGIYEIAGTHSDPAAYDGFVYYGTQLDRPFTGTLSVYGVRS